MDRIVVGVDGSSASVRALRWSLQEARLHGARVLAVHVYRPLAEAPLATAAAGPSMALSGAYTGGLQPSVVTAATERTDETRRHANERLTAAVGLLLGGLEDPDVWVETEAVAGDRPAQVLVDRSREADLLVVGSRGRGGMSGLLLGSVSRMCLAHAHCPVVVMR